MGTDPKRVSYPQMAQMAQIFRDADGEAERDGYPQISQMAQIPDPGLNNHEATAATLGRI